MAVHQPPNRNHSEAFTLRAFRMSLCLSVSKNTTDNGIPTAIPKRKRSNHDASRCTRNGRSSWKANDNASMPTASPINRPSNTVRGRERNRSYHPASRGLLERISGLSVWFSPAAIDWRTAKMHMNKVRSNAISVLEPSYPFDSTSPSPNTRTVRRGSARANSAIVT